MTDPARDKARDEALEEALKRLEDETAGPLRTWAEARQAEVQSVIPETSAADRGLSVKTFEELSGRRLRRRLGPSLALATALAAGLLAGFFSRSLLEQPEQPGKRTTLGAQSDGAPYPEGVVDDYDVFTWPEKVPQRRYGLRVWNAGRLDLKAALEIDGLTEPSYTPTAKDLPLLGSKIYWEVVEQDEDLQSLGTLYSASSSRSGF